MNLSKTALLVAAPVAAVVVPAGVAVAEQKTPFDWQFSGWLTGQNSRTWDADRETDFYLGVNRCRVNVPDSRSVELQLTRETPPWQPDINMGRHTYPCGSKNQWARRDAPDADYHFTLTRINGSTGCCGYKATANGRLGW